MKWSANSNLKPATAETAYYCCYRKTRRSWWCKISGRWQIPLLHPRSQVTRSYEGRTESHEQLFFLHANWEQQTKDSEVVDGASCCVILQCLVTSIACITWPVSLLTKWPKTICHFASVLSSNSLWKRKSLLQKFTRLQRAYGSVCMGASSVRRWVKHFKDGKTEAIQKAVRQCHRMAGTEFYRRGIFKLPERWKKCVQRSGDYVEKYRKLCRLRWYIWFVNIKHVTLQKIVAHDFRYDPRI